MSFLPGSVASIYVPAWGERVPGGVLSVQGETATVLLPDGSQMDAALGTLTPRQLPPVAPLRVGDIVTIPDAYQGEHEVTGVGDLIDLRHCESGGSRILMPDIPLLICRRADVADLYADFRLAVPKAARAVSLFGEGA